MITLKNILLINAVSSGATGILLAVAPSFFANLFEMGSTAPFTGVGIFLIAFAMIVFLVSRKNPINPAAVRAVVIADVTWVIASMVLIILQPLEMSLIGNLMVGAVAMWVLLMAILQNNAQKSLTSTTNPIR